MYAQLYTQNIYAYAACETNPNVSCDEEIDKDFMQPSVDHVISVALSHPAVIGARAFEWQGEIVVAVITTPFYLKSERDKAKEEIFDDITVETNAKSLTVTFDVGVYRNIREDMTDEQRERLYKIATSAE